VKALINVDVPDLARGEAFYVAGLGLTVGRRFGEAGVELLGSGAPIYLLEKPPRTSPFRGATQGRAYDRHWTPVHLDFAVDDLRAARARALHAGAVPEGDVETHVWGQIAYFSDPFGHGFCLLEFSQHGYDAIAT
jgi:lactoylglutathione lyase